MKTKKSIVQIGVILLLLLTMQPVHGQYVGSGSSTFAFLDLPVSARQNALGGENISIRDGELSSAFANPALLGSLTHNILQIGYAYYGTNHFGSAMYGYNFSEQDYFAAGIHYLDYGTMRYAEANGALTQATFGARAILIEAAYARQLGEQFTVGVALKPVMSFFESYSSVALGADIGAHFQMKDSALQIGLALKNVGWQLKSFYSDESGQKREMLPLNLEFGINYRVQHAPELGLGIQPPQRGGRGQTRRMVRHADAPYDLGFGYRTQERTVLPHGQLQPPSPTGVQPTGSAFTRGICDRSGTAHQDAASRVCNEPDVQAELHLSGQSRHGREQSNEIKS